LTPKKAAHNMDLKITTFGTDAREYTLASNVPASQHYKVLFTSLSVIIVAALFVLLYTVVIAFVHPLDMPPQYAVCFPVPTPSSSKYLIHTTTPIALVAFLFKAIFGSTVIEGLLKSVMHRNLYMYLYRHK
jgi:hypothetical protein